MAAIKRPTESKKKPEKFIQKAIKNPGRLTRAVGGAPSENLGKVRKLAKEKGKGGIGAAARLFLNVLHPSALKRKGKTPSQSLLRRTP